MSKMKPLEMVSGWRPKPDATAEPAPRVTPAPVGEVPEDLVPFLPPPGSRDEQVHVDAFRRSRRPVFDMTVPEEHRPQPVTPEQEARVRHEYRLTAARAAKAEADRRKRSASLETSVSTCPVCLEPRSLAVRPVGEGFVVAGTERHRLPFLGEVVCCAACRPVLEARAVELLRGQQLEKGSRGELVDGFVKGLLLHRVEQP